MASPGRAMCKECYSQIISFKKPRICKPGDQHMESHLPRPVPTKPEGPGGKETAWAFTYSREEHSERRKTEKVWGELAGLWNERKALPCHTQEGRAEIKRLFGIFQPHPAYQTLAGITPTCWALESIQTKEKLSFLLGITRTYSQANNTTNPRISTLIIGLLNQEQVGKGGGGGVRDEVLSCRPRVQPAEPGVNPGSRGVLHRLHSPIAGRSGHRKERKEAHQQGKVLVAGPVQTRANCGMPQDDPETQQNTTQTLPSPVSKSLPKQPPLLQILVLETTTHCTWYT